MIYTENVPYDNSTAANYKAWARVIGRAMTDFGWVKQSGHGELMDNGLSGASYDWNFTPLTPPAQLRALASYIFSGAWAGGTSYAGNNSPNGAASNLVTNGGITYQCISPTQYTVSSVAAGAPAVYTGTFANGGANGLVGLSIVIAGFTNAGNNGTFTITASTTTTVSVTNASAVNESHAATATLNTAPASDTLHWMQYNYEIWKSNGSNTSALPLYVRIVYTCSTTATIPGFHLSIGTGIDGNGNVTNAWPLWTSAPTTNKEVSYGTAATGASLWECDFSGDADNFRMFMWRNFGANSIPATTILVLDRAKNSLGQDADAFVFGGAVLENASLGASATSIIFFKSGLGTTFVNALGSWYGVILSPASGANWGSICALPVTPLVGFAANPCLGVVTFPWNDMADGQVIPVWMYGASHNFLVNKNQSTSSTSQVSGLASNAAVGIRWE